MAGEFLHPKTSGLSPTTAIQTIAMDTPAVLFAATTPIIPGVWASEYDAYVDGHMVMKAKVLSAVSVVNEQPSLVLDQISLRRWLLGSFDAKGGLIRFDAEVDGDLSTPNHGSGKHVEPSDYQLVRGMMVPMRFAVARSAGGKLFLFWQGRVTSCKVNC